MMKMTTRLFALLLCVLLFVCTAVAEDAAAEKSLYSDTTIRMTLQDQTSGRATLFLTQQANGSIGGAIEWSDSAFAYHLWTFSMPAEAYNGDGVIEYADCISSIITTAEDGTRSEEVLYDNGTGRLVPSSEGYAWQDDQENAGSNCLFVFLDNSLIVSTNYQDTVTQRATMEISGYLTFDEQTMDFTISWPQSASETHQWVMRIKTDAILTVDENTPTLAYTDGVYKIFTYSEDGAMTEQTVYENGTGTFTLCETEGMDGDITIGYRWLSDNEDLGEGLLFIPNMVEGPIRTFDYEGDENDVGPVEPVVYSSVAGGWNIPQDTVLDEDARSAFYAAAGEETALEPVELLGTQVVAGINYAILCRAADGWKIAYVYRSVSGECELVREQMLFPMGEGLAGGWTEPFEESFTAEEIDAIHESVYEAFGELDGVYVDESIVLGQQVVAGMNYAVLCRKITLTAEPAAAWAMATVYVDLEGNSSVTDMQDVVLSLYEE